MTGNFGAIAEGFFEGHGWLTSLGKAGVNKNRELKDNAFSRFKSMGEA